MKHIYQTRYVHRGHNSTLTDVGPVVEAESIPEAILEAEKVLAEELTYRYVKNVVRFVKVEELAVYP